MGFGHTHGPVNDRQGARRGLRITLVLTGSIFVAEVVGGLYAGSLALLSDAGHMLSDLGALIVSYFALLIAQRPADQRKTYGYYRTEILAALGNAVALLLLTAWIVWEAVERVLEPTPVLAVPMLGVALVGLVANGLALFVLRGHGANLNVRSAILHVVGDLVSSLGVVVGGLIILFTGAMWLDPVISFVIAGLIIVSAVRILREAVDILLESTPAGIDCAEVCRAMAGVEGVDEVHDLHIWAITSGMNALSGHVIVHPDRLPESHRILNDLKVVLFERFAIDHTTIQIEPVGYEHVGEVHEVADLVES